MEMVLEKQGLDMQSGMSDKLFVAVWMVTYNHEDYIEQAIESIVNQKANFLYKLFIGEDCSTDNTRQICIGLKEKYPDKIHLVLNERNVGASQNAQKIFNLCFNSGAKYVAMCEGDDYWTAPQKLQKQIDFLEANEKYVLTFHPVKILKPDGSLVEDFITMVPEDYETQKTLARSGNYIHTPSVVFRNIIKTFPPEFSLSPIGDYFLYMMLTNHGKIKMLEGEMAVYRYMVGVISKMDPMTIANNNVKMYSCMISAISDFEIKNIILEKQLRVVSGHYKKIEDIYNDTFLLPKWYVNMRIRLNLLIINPIDTFKRVAIKLLKMKI